MREENHSEVYTPINSKLKFGYFSKCDVGKNLDYNYVNEFYKSPFSINYWPGLVKAENIFQLMKEEDKMSRFYYHNEKLSQVITTLKIIKAKKKNKFQILISRF